MSSKSIIFKWPDPKFPDEHLEYTLDWNPRLEGGETIVGTPTVVNVVGMELTHHHIIDGISTFWFAGGDDFLDYAKINLNAVTSLGRTIGCQGRLRIAKR